jgi:hypothetical protein
MWRFATRLPSQGIDESEGNDIPSGVRGFQAKGACMLRTRRTGNGQVLFTLSGRIETTEDIEQLQQLLAVETSGQPLILDLRDVTLVNEDAVNFLRRCEADGIKLENCPLHVRRWIDQVRDRLRRRRA